jgi:hypothetical protein
MINGTLLRAAMTSLFALGAVSAASSAVADHHQEQCAGAISSRPKTRSSSMEV